MGGTLRAVPWDRLLGSFSLGFSAQAKFPVFGQLDFQLTEAIETKSTFRLSTFSLRLPTAQQTSGGLERNVGCCDTDFCSFS